jgi:hypothetical protein
LPRHGRVVSLHRRDCPHFAQDLRLG